MPLDLLPWLLPSDCCHSLTVTCPPLYFLPASHTAVRIVYLKGSGSDEGPTFLLFLPLAQAFFGGGANLMISSSEGCRIMSGDKKGCVQGQQDGRCQAGPLGICLHSPKTQVLQG